MLILGFCCVSLKVGKLITVFLRVYWLLVRNSHLCSFVRQILVAVRTLQTKPNVCITLQSNVEISEQIKIFGQKFMREKNE